jgi:glycosyltransferase involved in cell wall biosynthesis
MPRMNVDKKKKILFLICHLAEDGAQRVLSELSNHLEDDVEQVLVMFENKVTYPTKDKAKCIVLDCPSVSSSFVARVMNFIQKIHRFRKVVKQEKPDCVVSFLQEENIINILVSPKPIVTVHHCISMDQKSLYSRIAAVLISFLYNRAKIVTVSEGLKKDLVSHYGVKEDKISVIYNPININKIKDLALEKIEDKYRDSRPVVITAGRLTKQKGHWHLIRAFSQVKKRIDSRLLILGKGELEEDLKDLAANSGYKDDILFLGWQVNPFKYFSNASVFVLSSLYEGFGNVLVEAMACSCPVIAADCLSGPREIISAKNKDTHLLKNFEISDYGILVPVCRGKFSKNTASLSEEESVLAQAIERLLTDKELRAEFSKKGIERAADFKAERAVASYRKLFQPFFDFK